MKSLLPLIFLPLAFSGCDQVLPGVQGSGVKKTENRPIGPFEKVSVSTSSIVEVIHGDAPGLEIISDDNILPLISTEVKGGELTISSKGSFSTNIGIHVKLTAVSLKEIDVSGAVKLNVSNATADELKLSANGASEINWNGGAKKIKLNANGASRATLKGPVNELIADLNGASALHGYESEMANARVELNGASQAEVNVIGELSGKASGASNIRYVGTPRTSVSISDVSNVGPK